MGLIEESKDYKRSVEYYKEMIRKYQSNAKYKQDFSWELYTRLAGYIQAMRESGRPITSAGLILASGMSKGSWVKMCHGEMDHQLMIYMDMHDCTEVYDYDGMPCCDVDGKRVILLPMSEILEKIYLIKEDEVETRLYEKGRVADIFALKAGHGWIEEEKAPHTVNQTLVIASPKEAEEAIKLLK